jgi:hypothetical protein
MVIVFLKGLGGTFDGGKKADFDITCRNVVPFLALCMMHFGNLTIVSFHVMSSCIRISLFDLYHCYHQLGQHWQYLTS